MLKLLTLNVEGICHLDRVADFITREKPNAICLQEIPSVFLPTLAKLGYHTVFAPHLHSESRTCPHDVTGVAIASITPPECDIRYHYGNKKASVAYDKNNKLDTTSFAVILGKITHQNETYHIATTHLPVTIEGHEDPKQNEAVDNLLAITREYPSHLLCGDMNAPRGHNTNYNRLCEHYQDTVPERFKSSLDRNLHRDGNNNELNAPIFDIYMTDYIFSQTPYIVEEVNLHFGVSDHAALTALVKIAD